VKPRIGIARALYSYYNYPLFKTFIEAMGGTISLSPKTNKAILKMGIEHSPAEICLPVKAFLGHIAYLKNKVDYLFIPRIVCIKDTDKNRFGCPKAISLPDLVKATFDNLPTILELNWDERITSLKKELKKIAQIFSKNNREIDNAYNKSLQVQSKADKLMQNGLTPDRIFESEINLDRLDSLNIKESNEPVPGSIKVGVVGHPYLLHDEELGLNIVNRLKNLGASVITPTMLPSSKMGNPLAKFRELAWFYEQAILGSAALFLNGVGVDGLLLVSSFACGTNAVVNEIIHREIAHQSRIPILMFILDEHTAEAGIMTRLESFVDLIKLSKSNKSR
jgi:predicted nucleotide-binding protein (sugar kinase/HSP70/actin superfamily)